MYGNACDANASGVDIGDPGGCTPQPGMFGCGAHFCTVGTQFCVLDLTTATGAEAFSCRPLPSACGGNESCGCLPQTSCPGACGWQCSTTPNGGVQVTCCH
jgi:hypothetical protein